MENDQDIVRQLLDEHKKAQLENERLKAELSECELRYMSLVSLVPEALVLHVDHNVVFANEAAARLLGAESASDLIGRNMLDFLPEDYKLIVKERIERAKGGEVLDPLEIKAVRPDGREVYVNATAVKVPYKGETAFQVIIRDVTDATLTAEELKESENRYRALVDLSPEAIVVHTEGIIMYVNESAVRLFGYRSGDEIRGNHFMDFVPPECKEAVREKIEAVKCAEDEEQRKKARQPLLLKFIDREGRQRYLETIGAPVRYKGKPAAQVIIRDITESKMLEEELRGSREQLRNLAAYLQSAREEERTNVAREIHDELGQYLTGLKMDMSFVEDIVEEKTEGEVRAELLHKIEDSQKLIDTTVKTVRRISSELRPAVLDNLGLLAAIDWLAEEFQNRMGIICGTFIAVESVELGKDQQTAMFRMLQESLTNIMKHSGATMATIELREEEGCYVLEVRDNGKGFADEELEKGDGFGTLGIKERAYLFGGKASFVSEKGKGTRVIIEMPRRAEGAEF